MNALDQAFIKAFAKNRTASETRRSASTRRVTIQPPEEGVESASLVLHELCQQGTRLRVDRPNSDGIGLDAHMALPMVQHVESYQAEDVQNEVAAQVVFEDRLTPLDETAITSSGTLPGTDATAAETACTAATEPDSQGPATEPDSQGRQNETEAHAPAGTEAFEDREFPALAQPASDSSTRADRPAAQPLREQAEEVRVEEQLLAQCQPQVLLAAPQLPTPELMTRDLGVLETHDSPQLDASLSSVDVSPAAINATWLECQAPCAPQWGTAENTHSVLQEVRPTGPVPHRAQVCSTDGAETAVPDVAAGAQPESMGGQQLDEAEAAPTPIQSDDAEEDRTAFEPATVRDEPAGDAARGCRTDHVAGAVGESVVIDGASAAAGDAMGPAPLKPFTPAWEVDAFRWPEICLQLDEQTGGKLTQSGEELYVATEDGLRVLAVTGSVRQEGRTTLALCLARAAASAGSRVALFDADAGNPELARRLGLEAPCDWHEVLRQQQSLEEAAVASVKDQVTLFPLTCPNDDLSSAIDRTLARTLHDLRCYFDLVIVDLPPSQPAVGSDRPADSDCPVDMAVVVRHVQTTSQKATLETVATWRQLGVRAVGIIENFAPRDGAGVDE